MKKILIVAMVLIASLNLKAQKNIKGNVFEQMEDSTKVPIPGANVYWEGTTIGVATNTEGFYSISEPEKYPATLVVSFVGYQIYKQISEKWIDVQCPILLSPSVELQEVKVKGKVNTTKFSTINAINMQTLSTGELEKAACCNLSESFSTNATVDVTFSDAVSGAKQIQMLGLDGIYTQITQENMPLIRGISSAYGLSYVPGTWIESIQIIKGSGSVINGFESFAGQINLEYYKPESAPKLFWNMYADQEGKIENNFLLAKKSGNWKSNLFTHISYFDQEIDHNQDNFLDVPKVKQLNVFNRWKYEGKDNFRMSFTIRGLVEDRIGGTRQDADSSYTVDVHNDLIEFSSKTGVINSPGRSLGLQTLFRMHNQTAVFGKNNYKGLQESAYLNLIRQTYLGNTDHKLKYGTSYYADKFTESLNGTDYNRTDLMTGLFSEYSYNLDESFKFTAGLRADYYNNTEQLNYSPRLNMKYNPTEDMAIRFSAGKAFRIANVFVENASFLASNRTISLEELNPETAWNYGINIVYCFRLFGNEGTLNADAYRTTFENQIVVDIEEQTELSFYNLDGVSYANSMQLDLAYELFNRFDVKIAYKINDVITTFGGVEETAPLTPKNRALLNFSYATNFDKWMFDVTANYIGKSRIPDHYEMINENFILVGDKTSDPFYLFNAQVTKKFRKFDMYIGGENLLGYIQETPILDAGNPSSDYFDASLIYAPINGTMIYAGFRYKIK